MSIHSDQAAEKHIREIKSNLFAKVSKQGLEKAALMGWLSINQFTALFNIDEVKLLAALGDMNNLLGGLYVGDGLIGWFDVGDGLNSVWVGNGLNSGFHVEDGLDSGCDVGNGLDSGFDVGNGLSSSPKFRIEVKAMPGGEILLRTSVVL